MFTLLDPDHPLRSAAEALVRQAFRRRYDVQPIALPRWLAANVEEGAVVCAASLRFADDGFFSECYLDGPIEAVIAERTGFRPDRGGLVEVGNLAAGRGGEIGALIGAIVLHLRERGTRWAFFTATTALRAFLARNGIPLIDLCRAEPCRISNPAEWQGYFDRGPRVVLVDDLAMTIGRRSLSAGCEAQPHA